MKVISNYINEQLEGFEHDKAFFAFKKSIIEETTERVNALIKSGLTDMKAVEAIVIGEHPDIKQEFINYKSKIDSKEKAVQKGKLGSSLAVMGILLLVVVYIAVSFFTKSWGKTWLILVGGILIAVCCGLVAGIKKSVSKEKPNIPAARLMSFAAIMIFCVFAFLVGLILFSAVKSYIIFILGVAVALSADAAIASVAKSKIAFASLLVEIPAICALVYVAIGLFVPSVWATGWLIILLGLVVDIALLAVNVLKSKK
ncbi:MAG: hypothetical protein NC122_00830 [Faecalibacterium sp.]|nr:hypothetical protein [Ruminococcus sp.]MCM1391294.1 hypothetical protein [Ruminococcus sp.]MCM1484732.1 hypothetical protein [Faecalibacterium sp.]